MYRFLFSSKWLGYLLLAAIFASACVFLGRWQMDRRAETLAEIDRVVTNYSATPIPFSDAREQFNQLDPAMEWTQVELRGTYLTDGQRVVRNRPLNGQPGYEVVVPFRLASGETVVIDRGWLPIGNKNPGAPDSVPEPPGVHRPCRLRRAAGVPAPDRGVRPAGVGDSVGGGHAVPVPEAFHRGGDAPLLLAAVVRVRRPDVRRLWLRRTAAGAQRRY